MFTLKTAIGIAVHGDDLELVCLKRGLGGIAEAGRTRIANFRAQRADLAAAAYRDFLRACGLSQANAIVALPRRDVLLRTLSLPPEALRTLDKTVEYQVDGLHPFEEGGVDYAYAVLHQDPTQIQAAVLMVEKNIAASYSDWFAQAAIPVAGFTANPAVLYGAFAASAPVFVVLRNGPTAELLGISREVLVSREVQAAHLERELQLCRAEMRLDAEAQIQMIEQPDLAHLAAQSGLRKQPFAINLLPAEKRAYESPWRHTVTYALGAVVVLLLIALAARGAVQDRLYLSRVNHEIYALDGKVKYVQKLESREGRELTRILTLRELKGRTPGRIAILAELTRVLPPDASLSEADFSDGDVTMAGTADSASGLLALLSASPYFKSPEFLSSIVKNADGKEQFRIRVQLGAAAYRGAAAYTEGRL